MGDQMKKLILTIALPLFLVACGSGGNGRSGKTASRNNNDSRTFRGNVDTSALQSQSSNIYWGQIFDYNHGFSGVQSFQERAEDFLFPQLDAKDIGSISGVRGSTNTGIFFYGSGISFIGEPSVDQNGFIRRENAFDTKTSELRIEIEDLFNNNRGIIPIHFNEDKNGLGQLTGSLIEGNFVQLIFEDELGKVSFEGVLQSSTNAMLFVGDVYYRNLNYVRIDGDIQSLNEDSKFLGGFVTDACRFFNTDKIFNHTCN